MAYPAGSRAGALGSQAHAEARAEDDVEVVYIAGIGRSGSTLLARALGSIDGYHTAGEFMHLFGRGMARNEECACGARVRSCDVWRQVIEDIESRGLCDDPSDVEAFRHRMTEGRSILSPFAPWSMNGTRERFERFRALLSVTYRSLRRTTGCRVVVDSSKSPSYGRILLGVEGVRLHVVHLVRDSRGVAFSLQKRRRRPGTYSHELLDRRSAIVGSTLWSAANLLTESLRERAASFVRVRYTDFVRSPDEEVARVLRAVRSERGGEPPARPLPHLNGRAVRLGVQHVLASNPHVRDEIGELELEEDLEWPRRLARTKRWLVSALTLPLLRRYGYPLRLRDVSRPDDG